jgi:hypothetical protein
LKESSWEKEGFLKRHRLIVALGKFDVPPILLEKDSTGKDDVRRDLFFGEKGKRGEALVD